MEYRFYLLLKDVNSLKKYVKGPFSILNIKGRLIVSKYGKLISEVVNIIDSEKDLTKNTNLLLYFRSEGLVGLKLVSMLLRGCLKYDVGYGNHDIDYAVNCLDIECMRLKYKIDNYKKHNMIFENPNEIVERLKPFYTEEEIKEEEKFTKKLTLNFYDYRDEK